MPRGARGRAGRLRETARREGGAAGAALRGGGARRAGVVKGWSRGGARSPPGRSPGYGGARPSRSQSWPAATHSPWEQEPGAGAGARRQRLPRPARGRQSPALPRRQRCLRLQPCRVPGGCRPAPPALPAPPVRARGNPPRASRRGRRVPSLRVGCPRRGGEADAGLAGQEGVTSGEEASAGDALQGQLC